MAVEEAASSRCRSGLTHAFAEGGAPADGADDTGASPRRKRQADFPPGRAAATGPTVGAFMQRHVLLAAACAALLAASACRGHDAQPAAAHAAAASPSPASSAAPSAPPSPPPTMSNDPVPSTAPAPASTSTPAKTAVATLANGCFWCTEAVLEQVDGVLDVTSGYMGGTVDDPSYQQVCSGTTGHAECVQVTYDPSRGDYEALLDWFFRSHDPTTLNRQGADEGTQYRSAIFVHDDAQEATAKATIRRLQPQYARPIVTEVTRATRFWPAEAYHQGYFQANPNQGYCRAVIAPKLKKLGLKDAR
jgi:peptide-methionine (S)-S-oxide reductase